MKRATRIGLIVVLFGCIAAGAAFGGFYLGEKKGEAHPKSVIVQGVSNLDSGKDPAVDFGTFWEAWQLVQDEHLKGKDVSAQDRVYGAIKGLLASLDDPYSDFFNPQDSKKFEEDIEGNFGGIGAEIGFRDNQLVVVSPIKDTPASRAGLRAGDRIVKINDTGTEGIKIDRAVSLIRGPKGSTVRLLILRDTWEKPQEFSIVRSEIIVPTLDWDLKDGIATIKLYSFNGNADALFAQAIQKIAAQGANGMVLDLRNNPGGYLGTAIDLAGWFVPQNTLVVSKEYRTGEKEELRSVGNGALKDLPLVILVNEASASASEILAGTLRDNRKDIKLVGQKTFGKGTVQELKPLRDNSTIKLTVAHWVLPSGRILDHDGLVPDVEVKISDDDLKNNRDPQMQKALETLKTMMQ